MIEVKYLRDSRPQIMDQGGRGERKRAAHAAQWCNMEPSNKPAAGGGQDEGYSEGLVENRIEDVLLALAMGASLKGSVSGLSKLSHDSLQVLGQIVAKEWHQEQARAGYKTPPSSPRRKPTCPMAPARRSRARLVVFESMDRMVTKGLLARVAAAEEGPIKGQLQAPREVAIDDLFSEFSDCQSG